MVTPDALPPLLCQAGLGFQPGRYSLEYHGRRLEVGRALEDQGEGRLVHMLLVCCVRPWLLGGWEEVVQLNFNLINKHVSSVKAIMLQVSAHLESSRCNFCQPPSSLSELPAVLYRCALWRLARRCAAPVRRCWWGSTV